MQLLTRGRLLAGLTVALALGAAAPAMASGGGAVFAGTNHNNTSDPSQPANQIAVYPRAADGTLGAPRYYDTGGQGSGPGQRFAGDGLGSGDSVKLSGDRRWLFATNAGSNDVSVFRVRGTRLELTDVAKTGDGSRGRRFPNSVTQHGKLVYVLNSADDGSITGFRLTGAGKLVPLPGSTRGLDANQQRFAPDALYNPAQVSFTPDGDQLVVSIKDGPAAGPLVPGVEPTGPGRILVFGVGKDGRPSTQFRRTDLANRGPFGFSFDRRGNLLVALFVGGGVEDGAITGAAGSYRIEADGRLTPNTVASGDHQIDTCWLVNNGRYAYGANYTSGTISSWRVGRDGKLTLLESVAGTTDDPGNRQGSTPLDLRTSPDGRFLYLVQPGSGKVGAWRIGADGRLTKLGEYAGLPKTVDGDMAPADFTALGSPAGIDVS
jgi:6-phosphogluconolactonase (cycloisomerase 2 family)